MKTTTATVVLLLLLLCGASTQVLAQKEDKSPNYKKNAVWIQMMDDPNVNFFEAEKAFNTFWEGRGEPEKEQGEEHEEENHSIIKRIFISEEKLEWENLQYATEYKRYKQWRMDVLPFVQDDGSILSKEEQDEIRRHSRE